MKPTVFTPSTAILGVFWVAQHAAIVGSVRSETGALIQDAVIACGGNWEALADGLVLCEWMAVQHVVLLTNSAALVKALSRPFPAPRGGVAVRRWIGVRGDGKYVHVDLGDAAHWQVLRTLGASFAGQWQIQQVEDLPNARRLYAERMSSP